MHHSSNMCPMVNLSKGKPSQPQSLNHQLSKVRQTNQYKEKPKALEAEKTYLLTVDSNSWKKKSVRPSMWILNYPNVVI